MRISDWSSDVCSSDLTPSIETCEVLQGFPAGWTQAANGVNSRLRWRLVGNAVSVPVAEWVARRIVEPGSSFVGGEARFHPGRSEERRVGKGGVSMCRYGWLPLH